MSELSGASLGGERTPAPSPAFGLQPGRSWSRSEASKILLLGVLAGVARSEVTRDARGQRDEGRRGRRQPIPFPLTPKHPCHYCAADTVGFTLIRETAKPMCASPDKAEIDADAPA